MGSFLKSLGAKGAFRRFLCFNESVWLSLPLPFEVEFKILGRLFFNKYGVKDNFPRFIFRAMRTFTRVVSRQAFRQVRGISDIGLFRIWKRPE